MIHGLRQIQGTLDKPENRNPLSIDEYLWTELSIELVEKVNKQRGK